MRVGRELRDGVGDEGYREEREKGGEEHSETSVGGLEGRRRGGRERERRRKREDGGWRSRSRKRKKLMNASGESPAQRSRID